MWNILWLSLGSDSTSMAMYASVSAGAHSGNFIWGRSHCTTAASVVGLWCRLAQKIRCFSVLVQFAVDLRGVWLVVLSRWMAYFQAPPLTLSLSFWFLKLHRLFYNSAQLLHSDWVMLFKRGVLRVSKEENGGEGGSSLLEINFWWKTGWKKRVDKCVGGWKINSLPRKYE